MDSFEMLARCARHGVPGGRSIDLTEEQLAQVSAGSRPTVVDTVARHVSPEDHGRSDHQPLIASIDDPEHVAERKLLGLREAWDTSPATEPSRG